MGQRRLAAGFVAGFAALLVTGLVPMAGGQDLAALARKEKARRAAVPKPARVLTEEDVRATAPDAPSPTPTTGSEPATASTPSVEPPSSEALAAREEQERGQWKERAEAVRDAIKQAEARLSLLEKEFVALRSDLTQVSAAEAQDPMRLQKRDQKIAESYQAIEAQKRAVADARKALTQLEEDARRKGVPPGWIR